MSNRLLEPHRVTVDAMYWAACLGLLVACTSASDFCVEKEVSIGHGLYGRITYQSDVGPPTTEPQAGAMFGIQATPTSSAIVASATSNADGVFEVELPDGDFALCSTPNDPCVTFSISASAALVRADLLMSFIGTHWEITPRSECAE